MPQEPQTGFQPTAAPKDPTREVSSATPTAPAPTQGFVATSAPPVEQFPLYTAPDLPAGVQPYQPAYGAAEYSADVVVPIAKPKATGISRYAAIGIGVVAAVIGFIGIASWPGGVSSVEEVYAPPGIEEAYPGAINNGWMEPGGDYAYGNWRDTDMTSFNLTAANFTESDLRNATMTGAILTAADFSDADARGVDMANATAAGAVFNATDLRGANLSGTSFQGADLEEADLRGAILVAADFSGANLDDVDLRGATYDDATVWPTGFIVPSGAVKI